MTRRLLPLVLFFLLMGFLALSLYESESELPSPLIGKPIPEFSLENLITQEIHSNREIIGEVSLINVWATWCIACRVEHPFLMELKDKSIISIYGLNYKERDNGDKARKHLSRIGNPYEFSFFDPKGKLAIDLGVYGAPETFFIDKNGLIKIRHVGPLTADIWEEKFSALLKK